MAYGLMSRNLPRDNQVRAASVLSLAKAFSEWNPAAARRRALLAEDLLSTFDPHASEEVQEALAHAATILDIGRSIDYFDRHAHVADIVLATDLSGFSHRQVALLSAIVRNAGDEDSGRKSYEPLLGRGDRRGIERAAAILGWPTTSAERCRRGELSGSAPPRRPEAVLRVPRLVGWRLLRIGPRFERVFGRTLRGVPRRA